MTAREKVLHFMQLIGATKTADSAIDGIVGGFRANFAAGFSETLPDAPTQALLLVEETLRARKHRLTEAFAAVYDDMLTEVEVDDLITFHQSATGQRMSEIGESIQNKIGEAGNAWSNEALKSIEDELARILG